MPDVPDTHADEGTLDHPPLDRIAFAHASERVAAEILDFYRIRWAYEPRTFPIEWDAAGNVIASFTPDFYLPDFDLFIELTTMSQKLVTKKNRKVRRLKELYPEINIRIFYQKDFRALLARFGMATENREHAEGGGVVATTDNDSDTTASADPADTQPDKEPGMPDVAESTDVSAEGPS